MDDIGGWWNTWLEYFKAHWQEHVLPAVLQLGVTLTAIFLAVFAVIFSTFASALVGAAMQQNGIAGDWIMGLVIPLCWLLIGAVVVLAILPLSVGYARATLRSVRGTPIQTADLAWGYRRLGSVVLMKGLAGTATFVGLCFCFLPGILVSWMFGYNAFCLADRDEGAIDALGASWQLARDHFAALIVWELLMMAVLMAVAFIPFVGNLLVIPMAMSMRAVVYNQTTRQAATPAT